MKISPIRNEDNYNSALERIEEIHDAKLETEESNELEVLVTLVEAYEEKHYSIDTPNPIDTILFRMEQDRLK